MIVSCDKCGARFDDEYRWTFCPHNTFAANDGRNNFAHHPNSYISPRVQLETNFTALREAFATVGAAIEGSTRALRVFTTACLGRLWTYHISENIEPGKVMQVGGQHPMIMVHPLDFPRMAWLFGQRWLALRGWLRLLRPPLLGRWWQVCPWGWARWVHAGACIHADAMDRLWDYIAELEERRFGKGSRRNA
jgi:hypothetical protein